MADVKRYATSQRVIFAVPADYVEDSPEGAIVITEADRLAALERVRVMDAAVECRCDRLPADWDALRTDPLGHHPRCPSSSSAATTGDTDD